MYRKVIKKKEKAGEKRNKIYLNNEKKKCGEGHFKIENDQSYIN